VDVGTCSALSRCMHHHQGISGTAALVISGLLSLACGVIVFTGKQDVANAPASQVVATPVATKPSLGDELIVRELERSDEKEPAREPDPPPHKEPTKEPVKRTAPVATPVVASSDEPGHVRISTSPWGYATVPGQRIETVGGKLTLPPGKHTIFIKCGPECTPPKETTRTVIVKSGMTQNISIVWDEED
jgi:hypothetical protein